LKAAGLVDTLKGPGPFTVFAPTDDAFKKLPPGTVEDLLKPENKAKLTAILTYHVVAGKMMAAEVVKMKSLKSVQGSPIKVTVKGDKVMVNKANVVKTDVMASNGVIHVIDAVLMPPAKKEEIDVALSGWIKRNGSRGNSVVPGVLLFLAILDSWPVFC